MSPVKKFDDIDTKPFKVKRNNMTSRDINKSNMSEPQVEVTTPASVSNSKYTKFSDRKDTLT